MTWLTLPELCELLSITPEEWAQWCANGTAPYHENHPETRIHRADLAAWLNHYRTTHGTDMYTVPEVENVMRLIEQGRTPQQAHQEANLPPAVRERKAWMSVPDICAELAIDPEEWQQLRSHGGTPPHVILADGRTRVRRKDFDRWRNALPEENGDLGEEAR